ncbi:YciI family protein [Hydrocarboniphaga sp.]|uniref:YciI family protein n=1 Tax=Hydrocarboniphaga sp. TaxID=2033016 RepID=UPI003D1497AB
MKFMILLKASPATEAGEMPSAQLIADMGRYNEELIQAGIMLAGDGLHPSRKGARVNWDSAGHISVAEGPFDNAHRQLISGFWMWQCQSRQEAIAWIKRCPWPAGQQTEVEIRQVFTAEDFGAEFTPELREQEENQRARLDQAAANKA